MSLQQLEGAATPADSSSVARRRQPGWSRSPRPFQEGAPSPDRMTVRLQNPHAASAARVELALRPASLPNFLTEFALANARDIELNITKRGGTRMRRLMLSYACLLAVVMGAPE